ncbi:MAG: L-threonylcarbamoyladenylate synthase, partial [Eggerthellaceae bacterium]
MAKLTSTMQETVAALKRGDAALFPTETVYGLGVAVDAAESPRLRVDLQGRDQGKPISWLVADAADLDRYGGSSPTSPACSSRSGPPLTLIVKASEAVPAAFRSAEAPSACACRQPNGAPAHPLGRVPLATTLANMAARSALVRGRRRRPRGARRRRSGRPRRFREERRGVHRPRLHARSSGDGAGRRHHRGRHPVAVVASRFGLPCKAWGRFRAFPEEMLRRAGVNRAVPASSGAMCRKAYSQPQR